MSLFTANNVPTTREGALLLCGVAEEASRFDDMVTLMRAAKLYEQELTVDERNLFSVAYKELVGLKRKSLRRLNELDSHIAPANDRQRSLLHFTKDRVMKELIALCNEALDAIENRLLETSVLTESLVFYHKMTGDYLRYLAEFSSLDSSERDSITSRARVAYEKATTLARGEGGLSPTNPVRLGLALNVSVFEFEIIGDTRAAFAAAQATLAEAMDYNALEEMLPQHQKDATLIMQLLRDNIYLWSPKALDDMSVDTDDESMEAAPLVERMKKDGAAAAGLSHPIPVETQARSTVVED